MFKTEYCKTKAGYEVKLEKPKQLNLEKIKQVFEIVADAGILLVIKVKEKEFEDEVIVHDYGTLKFKKLMDEKIIKKIADDIFKVGL